MNLEKEIVSMIEELSKYGKDEEGEGLSRLLYDENWIKAQEKLYELMEAEGLEVNYDGIGNLFAKLEGTKYKDETIMTGSHIDTVKQGGKYDGQYGVVAGVLALKYLKEEYGKPLRNIEVVSISEEEGSRFPYVFWGVKNIFNLVDPEEVKNIKDSNGVSFVEAMNKAGFELDNCNDSRDDIKAFIELHVEQGCRLETDNKSVGVVTAIAGQNRYNVELIGSPNHAGTTPMSLRNDALHGATIIINKLMELANEYGDPLVCTVGELNVEPNIVNVVPGKVMFSIDLRHTEQEILDEFSEKLQTMISKIAAERNLESNIDMWMKEPPTPMDDKIIETIESQCSENECNYMVMHSGAGHDSQIFAKNVPTGMLFVPSCDGVSHSPKEFTETKDLVNGVKILIDTLYQLAYKDY